MNGEKHIKNIRFISFYKNKIFNLGWNNFFCQSLMCNNGYENKSICNFH